MKKPEHPHWLEVVQRRPLTAEERAQWLRSCADDSARQSECELELQLTEALRRLPPAPVPANFTARVLRSLPADGAPAGGFWVWGGSLLRLVPRWAPALGLVLALGGLYFRHATLQHATMAASVAEISGSLTELSAATSGDASRLVDLLRDYEAIDSLRRATAGADEELLAGLSMAPLP